ncbi:MAG: nucleotide sugar dehydrogenase [Nanoarchaeota archaeon]|nr:nucleotide sugar dehydrogenase [Nanoarchaeota archaeon]
MTICIVGLGYVGLPLAVKFGLHQPVLGYDIHQGRIDELKTGHDSTFEVDDAELRKADITFTTDPAIISQADIIIVAIPTPVDEENRPDLEPVLSGCRVIGEHLKKGATVIFESTVYPGCTERDCKPVLEEKSGLKSGSDFHIAYSPERINPGDKVHTVETIVKVVSGDTPETLEKVATLYEQVIKAGVHRAPSIMVAEAAKIIENTQRDINIGLMNELKMIFDRMGINIYDVLEAAGTKWNFLKFHPGLVGGHCIGVDPYYLAAEAKRLGHHPEIILAGRSVNDNMAHYEASQIIKDLARKGNTLKGLKLLVLGGAFKPDVPDMRNSKVKDLIADLKSYGCDVSICEPHFKGAELFGAKNVSLDEKKNFDVSIKAVKHKAFGDVQTDYTLL